MTEAELELIDQKAAACERPFPVHVADTVKIQNIEGGRPPGYPPEFSYVMLRPDVARQLVAEVRRLQTFEAAMRARFEECPIHAIGTLCPRSPHPGKSHADPDSSGQCIYCGGAWDEPCPTACPWVAGQ